MSEPVMAHVTRYSRQVAPALARQRDATVSSPLGAWLLVALAATAAAGAERGELEELLGCRCEEAAELAGELLSGPPRALVAAGALWVRAEDRTEALARWSARLPTTLEQGPIPTQAQADDWAERHSLGLIPHFPLSPDATTRLILASALAAKVSWEQPFGVVPSDHLGPSSPWRDRVGSVLSDPGHNTMAVVDTEAAGRVGVHAAQAREGLTVISVIAAPGLPPDRVTAAGYEVAPTLAGGVTGARVLPLSELPLGEGPAWTVEERPVRAGRTGGAPESSSAVLPAWDAKGRLDLLADPVFGAATALSALGALLPPGDLTAEARQVAAATYDRYGFQAAAVTAIATRTSLRARPGRHLHLCFDRPFAVLAVVGSLRSTGPQDRLRYRGLPVFQAWVSEVTDADRA